MWDDCESDLHTQTVIPDIHTHIGSLCLVVRGERGGVCVGSGPCPDTHKDPSWAG